MVWVAQVVALFAAAVGGGAFGVLVKSLFDRRKTGAEAEKLEAEAGAVTMESLRKLVLDLITQVTTLQGQYLALNTSNAALVLRNAELETEIAVLRELNGKLKVENEQGKAEREEMLRKIRLLEHDVKQLEAANQGQSNV